MARSFLITGHGRCATKWLAALMDQSPTWRVEHEPEPRIRHWGDEQDLAQVQKVFARDKYGEVNSLRRTLLLKIDTAWKGVILRHPLEILSSAVNADPRPGPVDYRDHLGQIAETLGLIDVALQRRAAVPLYFHLLTQDPDYTQAVIESAGIDDVRLDREMFFQKTNQRPLRVRWLGVPAEVRRAAEESFAWFSAKHGLPPARLP